MPFSVFRMLLTQYHWQSCLIYQEEDGKCFEGSEYNCFQLWRLHTVQVGPTTDYERYMIAVSCYIYLYIHYRKQLEEALQLYEECVHKLAHESKSSVVVEALCNLTYLCIMTGERFSEQDYLERTLHELKSHSSEGIPSVS